ncbi:hypothetical protein WMF27_21865 [Sorangium sp. So ce281]
MPLSCAVFSAAPLSCAVAGAGPTSCAIFSAAPLPCAVASTEPPPCAIFSARPSLRDIVSVGPSSELPPCEDRSFRTIFSVGLLSCAGVVGPLLRASASVGRSATATWGSVRRSLDEVAAAAPWLGRVVTWSPPGESAVEQGPAPAPARLSASGRVDDAPGPSLAAAGSVLATPSPEGPRGRDDGKALPRAIASICARARAECSEPKGASSRASSATVWTRSSGSFSRQRRMMSSIRAGRSIRCTRGGVGACMAMATKSAEILDTSKGNRAVRSW